MCGLPKEKFRKFYFEIQFLKQISSVKGACERKLLTVNHVTNIILVYVQF